MTTPSLSSVASPAIRPPPGWTEEVARRFLIGGWVVALWAALSTGLVLLTNLGAAPPLLAPIILTAAPLAAAVACLRAGQSGAPSLRMSWLHFAMGSGAIVLREVLQLAPPPGMDPASVRVIAFGLLLAAHLVIAAGAAMAIPPLRGRSLGGVLLLDLALVITAGALFALKLGAQHGGPAFEPVPMLRILSTHLSAALSMFLLGLMLVWRNPALQIAPVAGLVVGGVIFASGNAAITLMGPQPGQTSPWMNVLWLAGWAGLMFAGVSARALGPRWTPPNPGPVAAAMGGFLIPAGALYMGALGLDHALRPYVGADISLALWFLSAPLAVRVGLGLRAEVRRQEQGRELVNTRALAELSRALAGAVELKPTLHLATRWANRLTGARTAAILLLSADEETLEVSAISGLPAGALGQVLPAGDSLTGAVVRERRLRMVEEWPGGPEAPGREFALFGAGWSAVAPLLFRERALGVLVVAGRPRPFREERLEMLASLADTAAVAIENAQLFEEVKALSLLDPLTGLANRRALERDLAREFAAARRGRLLSAVLFDIDGFKRFNDTLGHIAGDQALRTLGGVLLQECRAMNLAARYGGDEFLALMSDTDSAGAETFAQRTRSCFCQAVAGAGAPLDLTYGIAEYDPSMDTPAQLIAAADRALYRAKGRSGSADAEPLTST